MECVKCSHFLPSGQALQFATPKTANSLAPVLRGQVEADSLSLAPRTHSSPKPAHGPLLSRPTAPPPASPRALHRAANDRQGMENAPQRRRDSGHARRRAAAERPEGRGGRRPGSGWGPRGLGRTSLSGTHCGSSKPKGLPKARCSGTMRRPLGERTSFLASRRAATPEDMSPPEPLKPPPALIPHRAPPRSARQHDDSPKAQSAATARNMSQSECSIRPRAALLQSLQSPRPYDRPPIDGEDQGAPSAL